MWRKRSAIYLVDACECLNIGLYLSVGRQYSLNTDIPRIYKFNNMPESTSTSVKTFKQRKSFGKCTVQQVSEYTSLRKFLVKMDYYHCYKRSAVFDLNHFWQLSSCEHVCTIIVRRNTNHIFIIFYSHLNIQINKQIVNSDLIPYLP